MTIDRALRESGGERDLIKRRDLKATLGEQLQPSRDEEGPGFGLATLMNDSHGYLGYFHGPYTQDFDGTNGLELIPMSIEDTNWSLD